MADVLDFKRGRKKVGKRKAVTVVADTRTPAFFDDTIDHETVFKVLRDPKIQLAFVTMLLALRQVSTDSDVTISIDADGVCFDSVNSIETGDPLNGFQANMSLVKQGYLFMFDELGDNAEPVEMTLALGELLESLIMYYEPEDGGADDEPIITPKNKSDDDL